MFDAVRFSAYRAALGVATAAAFRSQRVTPLGLPSPHRPGVRPFGAAFPDMPIAGLYDPDGFPAEDEPRLRRIETSARLLHALGRVSPTRTPEVPDTHDAFVAAVYTPMLRRAWPHPPAVPAALRGRPGRPAPDVLAHVAVAGPFASYLQRTGDELGHPRYVMDVSWLLRYPVRPGLRAPGGIATFEVTDEGLRTSSVTRLGTTVRPAPWRARRPEESAMLAGLNEDLTTFRHNVSCHLAVLTPFAVASQRRLGVDHPVRRLLHHCFHTVLVGNREVGQLQLGGPDGFSATVFSHDHTTLAAMASEYLARFDFWDFDPDEQFARHGTTATPFPYPYRDNVLQLWRVTHAYVERYLGLSYVDDAAVAADAELTAWLDDLDLLLPQGIRRGGVPPGRGWLARACATVIHLSTVEHDILNNVTWDYSTLGWIVPTVAPLDGRRMDQRRAFDLLATLIGTWKPYNMLLSSDVPAVALDEPARAVMQGWIDSLELIQREASRRGTDPSLSYPLNLNVSISN